jgi:hypothetical protein
MHALDKPLSRQGGALPQTPKFKRKDEDRYEKARRDGRADWSCLRETRLVKFSSHFADCIVD